MTITMIAKITGTPTPTPTPTAKATEISKRFQWVLYHQVEALFEIFLYNREKFYKSALIAYLTRLWR